MLVLNPFERYMLADDRPSHPMCFLLRLDVPGRWEIDDLRRAAEVAAADHPLIGSTVSAVPGPVRWNLDSRSVPVRQHCPEEFLRSSSSWQIDLQNQPGVVLSYAPPPQTDSQTDSQTQAGGVKAGEAKAGEAVEARAVDCCAGSPRTGELWIQVHHACSDAKGVLDFADRLLRVLDAPNFPVAPSPSATDSAVIALRRRPTGRTRRSRCYLWPASPQWRRAIAYYVNRSRPWTVHGRSPGRDGASRSDSPPFVPSVVTASWPIDGDVWSVRRTVTTPGGDVRATVNDVLVAGLFHALAAELNATVPGVPPRQWIRIAVPIDQRGSNRPVGVPADCAAEAPAPPASNRTSMVYLDRRVGESARATGAASTGDLVGSVAREMQHVKRRNLETVLNDFLRVLAASPRTLAWAVNDRRCAITSVLSNLGRIEEFPGDVERLAGDADEFTAAGRRGRLREFVVPRRPGTNIAVGVFTSDDQLRVTLHHDLHHVPSRSAASLLDRMDRFCRPFFGT